MHSPVPLFLQLDHAVDDGENGGLAGEVVVNQVHQEVVVRDGLYEALRVGITVVQLAPLFSPQTESFILNEEKYNDPYNNSGLNRGLSLEYH